MADLGGHGILRDDDAGALDVVVNEVRLQARTMVDVIESVSEVGGGFHSRKPGGEHGEARILGVSKTIHEIGSDNEIVDQIDVVPGKGSTQKLDQTAMVAPANGRQSILKLREVNRTANFPLEDDRVLAANRAPPGGR